MSEQKENQGAAAGTSAADDVATLYSWANLHGAKYRDFTASRQELRAQARYRAAQAEAESRAADVQATPAPIPAPIVAPIPAQIVDENIRVGGWPEPEQSEPGQAELDVQPAAPEVAASEHRRAGFEETIMDASHRDDLHTDDAPIMPAWLGQVGAAPPISIRTEALPQPKSEPRMLAPTVPSAPVQLPQAAISAPPQRQPAPPQIPMAPRAEYGQAPREFRPGSEPRGVDERYEFRPPMQEAPRYDPQEPMRAPEPQYPQYPPPQRWQQPAPLLGLGSSQGLSPDSGPSQGQSSGVGRSEMRWSALQDLFDTTRRNEPVVSSVPELQAQVVALFSLAGGVGKTSLTANLGRALSAHGERTLLTETSTHGVLPFYFGARNPRPGVVRTFASNSQHEAPVQVISLDGDRYIEQGNQTPWLYDELSRSGREASRIVIDVTGGLLGSIKQVLRLNPVVVIPVLPDMSSAAALQSVDNFFRAQRNGQGRVVEPYFLLNQFDPSVPLHRDVRDMLHQKYGDRLLPFLIHRSSAVSEALAEGLTVMDYAPGSEVAKDILHFASWVRSLADAGASAYRGVRWSEQ